MNNLLASFSASTASVVIFTPFEVIRTKQSISNSKQSIANLLYQIYKKQGWRGFYRGVGLALLTTPISTSLYFCSYETIKEKLKGWTKLNQESLCALSSIATGIICNTVTNPLWLIKTRIQATDSKVTHLTKLISNIYKTEGLKGFYKGLGASYLGLLHVGIYFPLYEKIKSNINQQNNHSNIIVASSVAKIVSTISTYPNIVFTTKIQCDYSNTSRRSLRQVIKEIYNESGFKGFFRGLKIDVMRSVPSTVLTFLIYERIKQGSLFLQQ